MILTMLRERGAHAAALCLAAGSLALVPPTAGAQGALSTLGFGYPTSGLSTRALGSGGSISEVDPQSPLNPAALVVTARAQAYFQFDPEIRTVDVGGVRTRATTERFPVFVITGSQGRATFALSYSSFMDRTWVNSYPDTQVVNGEPIASTVFTSSSGGIADARAAMAWTVNPRLHFGIGVHVLPGQDRVSTGRAFADSSNIGAYSRTAAYTFSGTAVSLGGVWVSPQHLAFAADLRLGGTLEMRTGDTTEVGSGRVPLRVGLSATYDGIPGAAISARYARERWSDLRGLGSASLGVQDASDLALGAEVVGPRVGSAPILLRAGFRSRDLPFTYQGAGVGETAITGGFGIPVAQTRGFIDFAIARNIRRAPGIKERAWVLSFGVGIRP